MVFAVELKVNKCWAKNDLLDERFARYCRLAKKKKGLLEYAASIRVSKIDSTSRRVRPQGASSSSGRAAINTANTAHLGG